MEKNSFMHRTARPVLLVFILMAVSYAGYFGSRAMDGGALHQAMAKLFGTTYFLSITFGIFYVYTISSVRGAPTGESILASLVNPFIWMTKEVLWLTHSHPFSECLYWYLNPLNFWLACFAGLQIGIATLAARRILRKRGADVKVLTPVPIIVIIISLSLVVGAYAWGKGENLYVIFLSGYRLLFGSGV